MRAEYYHVLNRGVDKRQIVINDRDRLRFVTDLYVMNDRRQVFNLDYHTSNSIDVRRQYEDRKRLVTVHAWCLMGNHYHALISEHSKNGVAEFLKKLNMGYAKYFNLKHKRSGALFQGKTKRILIENDRQYLYILPYIHLNPLDFKKSAKEWRQQCLANPKAALQWITDYRWSSYRNYVGETEFSEILEGSELFADRKSHAREVEHFLKEMSDQALLKLNLE